ncbi:MAG: bifunctional adenosylcobinamide kinase/adenosylcobinamide-phosphate guanylyltransferase [Paenibacillaceae bacterium]|uniref:Adenosylcobinamide kinase n=1 Tax=Paenibacillus mellifer TaxID=2937794 RepID=A0A9X2BRR0_9BACL|nr:bifunctional adenosylcobinamide kinase/adenosylcobinamide-phosphate guanylyltransferase [Paenibacillus mellifer]MBW4840530.1 bifunctional adenosylcobinamide kinase/adenosylcobinamide-phosphate guanylyltransferase [Paenibacillaceae bacterium]MCK8485901.1 bifunctional adenosylcobinamide kinase/adenosylcobinamide-phosphate guanylyltransferase [Paenibacillus mellifer]
MKILVTGGARSGKSTFAERWVMKQAKAACYVATAQAFDDEMKARINLHRLQREQSGFAWTTREAPLGLVELLQELGEQPDRMEEISVSEVTCPIVLIDCLTLWLSNVLLRAGDGPDTSDAVLAREIERLAAAVEAFPGTLVMVTNEVGSGIVPEYPLGRQYRDWAGLLNRTMASISDQVFLVTAGIPIELKSLEYRL